MLIEVFSAAGRKHRAKDCLNLCPKCAETRLRGSVSSNNFQGLYPGPPFKEEGREGKREGGIRRNGVGRKKDKGEGEGREGG
jgi:hypothetical protein